MKKVITLVLLTCFSLIAFGQVSINPPKRVIQGSDTFSIFTIQSERNIAFKLIECDRIQQRLVVAEALIDSCEAIGRLKDTLINKQTQESANLRLQISQMYKVLEVDTKQAEEAKKQLKTQERMIRRWEGASFGASALLILLVIFK